MSNPYEPPKVPLETSQTSPGFRWRLVPCFLLVIVGAYTVFASLVCVLLLRSRSITHGLEYGPTLGWLTIGIAGGIWIVSGAMFWKRRWWMAITLSLVGYAVGVFGGWLIWGWERN
jgi:hypothetical protein